MLLKPDPWRLYNVHYNTCHHKNIPVYIVIFTHPRRIKKNRIEKKSK